ncbi:hypothetical protein [Rhodoferax sp.]|uniref:hypothetical protein n=1 Tax=Rhodoferax sp. TaxID=50421 RepID=UPI00374D8D5A
MTSFIQPSFPTVHPGVARAESVVGNARSLYQNFDSTKGLSTMLLAAVVSALVVVADQMVDTWAEGHLLAAWVVVWAVGFAAMALFAGTARRLAGRAVATLDAWSLRQARARADQRLWATALSDPRIMADLQVAMGRHEQAAIAESAEVAPKSNRLGEALLRAFDRLDAQAYNAAQYRLTAHL